MIHLVKNLDEHILHGKKKRSTSLVRCGCGKEFAIRRDMINKIKSCGCLSSRLKGHRFNDLTGKKLGSLTVVERLPNIGSEVCWKCKCDCGNTSIVQSGTLLSGHSRSCGCRGHPPEFGWFRHFYTTYQVGAKRRNLSFDLSFEDFCSLIQNNCYYCGSSPILRADRADLSKFRKIIPINGVDRIDSFIGYLTTNVVACCTTCNFAKQQLTVIEFKQWIESLCRYNFPLLFNNSNNA